MTAKDRLGLVQTLLGLEDDNSSINAEGSTTSTQGNTRALTHWEAIESPVKIRMMKFNQQQAKSGSTTPSQALTVRLGTMKLGETTQSLETPHVPTYIQALPSCHPGGLGQ